ncbi:NUDIX domain-containing protein [Steroidobacter sp. S1-65]|uniref:NUDIX domain-containing protein n=1 Tax=Steroidobacter gossypii TaxID=2805490 RepID=A0ABS1WYD6_9GAMM|nr:NUDIX domain-containing protein [Steroidobacter gossypii]MBM0105997.1 NUDIX domain-containing protein [Steroidobacter gossypii]
MNPNVAVIIGRFQILQRGHGTLLKAALALAPRVLIVIGSAFRARDAQNPFTWEERKQQFEAVLSKEHRERVEFLPVRDYYDDQRWGDAVRAGLERFAGRGARVTLVGFKKDRTSGYLDAFPGWTVHEVEPQFDINASDLRRVYFESTSLSAALTVIGNYVEPGVRDYLEAWAQLPAYRQCQAEHRAVAEYREKYTAPFYLTADSVVTTQDHVLLIKRGGTIGHGLWALPGGFVDAWERFYPAAVRELAEETGYKPHPAQLRAALKASAVFDHPARSARGRIITNAFHFDLKDAEFPDVQGADDAKLAQWVPIAQLPSLEPQLFEDHACILDHFLGLYPAP